MHWVWGWWWLCLASWPDPISQGLLSSPPSPCAVLAAPWPLAPRSPKAALSTLHWRGRKAKLIWHFSSPIYFSRPQVFSAWRISWCWCVQLFSSYQISCLGLCRLSMAARMHGCWVQSHPLHTVSLPLAPLVPSVVSPWPVSPCPSPLDLCGFYRPPSYPPRDWFSPHPSVSCWLHQPPLLPIIYPCVLPCQNLPSFPMSALLSLLRYLVKSEPCSNMESYEALLVNQKQDIKKAGMVGKRHSPMWLPEATAGTYSWRDMLLENNLSADQELFAIGYLHWQTVCQLIGSYE